MVSKIDEWYHRFKCSVLERYLPSDFDFSKSVLRGHFENYRFDKVLADSGSQALVLKFSGEKSDVVFKDYRLGPGSSTNVSAKDTHPAWFRCNEQEIMWALTAQARISLMCEELAAKRFPIKQKNGLDILWVEPGQLRSQAMEWRDLAPIQACKAAVSPLEVDRIYGIKDLRTGKEYLPVCAPPPVPRSEAERDWVIAHQNSPMVPIASVYECIEGESLDKVILSRRSIARKEAIVKELVRSLMVVHGIGVVHRDLKPENIIVCPDGRVKIVDFGIAQQFAPSDRASFLLKPGIVRGEMDKDALSLFPSRDWMGPRLFSSPQAQAGASTPQDDLFSLGIIASILLTGYHPFLDSSFGSWADFMRLPSSERKAASREYHENMVQAMEHPSIEEAMVVEHERFLSKHCGVVLGQLADTFHPLDRMRPVRMFEVGRRFGFSLPLYGHMIDSSEVVVQSSRPQFSYEWHNWDIRSSLSSALESHKWKYMEMEYFSIGNELRKGVIEGKLDPKVKGKKGGAMLKKYLKEKEGDWR